MCLPASKTSLLASAIILPITSRSACRINEPPTDKPVELQLPQTKIHRERSWALTIFFKRHADLQCQEQGACLSSLSPCPVTNPRSGKRFRSLFHRRPTLEMLIPLRRSSVAFIHHDPEFKEGAFAGLQSQPVGFGIFFFAAFLEGKLS